MLWLSLSVTNNWSISKRIYIRHTWGRYIVVKVGIVVEISGNTEAQQLPPHCLWSNMQPWCVDGEWLLGVSLAHCQLIRSKRCGYLKSCAGDHTDERGGKKRVVYVHVCVFGHVCDLKCVWAEVFFNDTLTPLVCCKEERGRRRERGGEETRNCEENKHTDTSWAARKACWEGNEHSGVWNMCE